MRIAWLLLISLAAGIVASAQDPVSVDPAHYRLVFENAHMGVLEYRDKPGDKAPMHSHPAYMTQRTTTGPRPRIGREPGRIQRRSVFSLSWLDSCCADGSGRLEH